MTPEQASETAGRLEKTISDGGVFTAADFPQVADGRRFTVSPHGTKNWEVSGTCIRDWLPTPYQIHVCLCRDERMANMIADALHAAAVSQTGRGVPIGVNDRNGKSIHIGDRLLFDSDEWYRNTRAFGKPDGPPMEFTIELRDGQIQHPGATGDLSNWCEIIQPWDAKGTPP